MTEFKKGDKFIPRKPKKTTTYHGWTKGMNPFDGKIQEVKEMTINGWLQSRDNGYCFHPDWCEKVGDSEIPNDHIPDVGKTIDWEQRRYELAKSAMQGMTTNEYYLKICASKAEDNKTEWENILCSNAINVADEMIKQLKEQ